MTSQKPKILLLVDKRDWAYDHSAQSLMRELSDEFEFKTLYVAENPLAEARAFDCDLLHVFWWGESWHHALNLPSARILKEISSFRWREEEKFGFLDPQAFVVRHLSDAATLVATSRKLQELVNPLRPTFYTPNGFDPDLFHIEGTHNGPMVVGWAGNIDDACKGIKDIIMPACEGDYRLVLAPGGIRSREAMRQFYNQIDVFCIASTAEGEPLTLIESMACGCFPITVDVGIVPEMVAHRDNGLIVHRSVGAFRAALTWCDSNLDFIRQQAAQRAAHALATRSWQQTVSYWRTAYRAALAQATA